MDQKGIYTGCAVINSDQGGSDSLILVQVLNASKNHMILYENTTMGHLYIHDGKGARLPHPNIHVFPITPNQERFEENRRRFESQAMADHSNWLYPANRIPSQTKSTNQEFLEQVNWEGANLTSIQKDQLSKLLIEYQDVFLKDDNDLGKCGLIKH